MKTYYYTAIVLLLIAIPFSSEAQIPRTLSYQGVLTDTSGVPKPDGSYTLTFRLYDLSAGGSAIWTEAKTLKTKGGLFYTILADQTPFGSSVTFDKPYWLSIQVGAGPEMSSRIPLTSVAYSLNATNGSGGSGFSNYFVFETSGTFTVRAGVSKIMVEMWGGGGGGGGAIVIDSVVTFIGGGGGGGGYAKTSLDVTQGTNYNVIVGLGGTGGSPGFDSSSTAGSGSNGGTTRFGGISVTGGGGGDGGCYDSILKRHCPGVGGGGGKQDEGIAHIVVSGGDGGWAKNSGFGGGTGGGGSSTNVMGAKKPGGGGASSWGWGPKGYGWAGASGRVIVWW
ncbi:MAG: hypothetical protein A2059_00500 [Ignavibacteria bacterium GWA2_55_25]|nr:MAG: hypothetical protein A2059_00500 [Ignavibacteria bacterium GWA2_55_25]